MGWILAASLWLVAPVGAAERVTIASDGTTQEFQGRVVLEAQDGGLLFETPDGQQFLWEAQEIQSRRADAAPFRPLTREALGAALVRELGPNTEIHETQHYVIAYDTSPAFAFWVGGLYERLYRGFHSYARQRGIDLSEPEFPLPIIIFGDSQRYREYAEKDLGGDPGSIIAYYQMLSNRVVLFDITGVEKLTPGNRRYRNADQINRLLSQPASAAMVATIVHEATHQIAYNSGLQQRLADIPMWLNEGLAMFFETPDLSSRSGWRGIGAVNPLRLPHFQGRLGGRLSRGLEVLLLDDARFRNEDSADAYAEAWALVFYLSRARREEFAAYLQALADQPPLSEETDDERLQVFQEHFGGDLKQLEQDFERFMQRVR